MKKRNKQKVLFKNAVHHILTGFFLMGGCLVFFAGCEEPFEPEIPDSEPELVVEGFLEAGDNPAPPFVILTRSLPFFNEIGQEALDNLFVHNAEITVRESDRSVVLTEICLNELSEEQIELASGFFGVDFKSFTIDFCLYSDFSFEMVGEEGKTYELTVLAEGKELTATTFIPDFVGLDTLYFDEPPGEPNDTLMQLIGKITDPPGETNYYRYFTKTNDEPLFPGFPSVTDDAIFDGLEFDFPLAKASSREINLEDIDINTLGLFTRGDSVTVKWTTIDQPHFNFWNTLEFNAANAGPFSTYTRIESNVSGGLGVWGGYHAYSTNLVVPE